MYKSDYYSEKKPEKKNGITSAALTIGIIVTLLIGILLWIKVMGTAIDTYSGCLPITHEASFVAPTVASV